MRPEKSGFVDLRMRTHHGHCHTTTFRQITFMTLRALDATTHNPHMSVATVSRHHIKHATRYRRRNQEDAAATLQTTSQRESTRLCRLWSLQSSLKIATRLGTHDAELHACARDAMPRQPGSRERMRPQVAVPKERCAGKGAHLVPWLMPLTPAWCHHRRPLL